MAAVGNVVLGEDGTTIWVGDNALTLTGYEQRVLAYLLQAGEGKLCTKAELELAMYNGGVSRASSNVVEVMVSRIRKRLRDAGGRITIETVRKRGYELRALPVDAEMVS